MAKSQLVPLHELPSILATESASRLERSQVPHHLFQHIPVADALGCQFDSVHMAQMFLHPPPRPLPKLSTSSVSKLIHTPFCRRALGARLVSHLHFICSTTNWHDCKLLTKTRWMERHKRAFCTDTENNKILYLIPKPQLWQTNGHTNENKTCGHTNENQTCEIHQASDPKAVRLQS